MLEGLNQAPNTTPLDPDELAQLIPALATKAELNEYERLNILEARRWVFNQRVLSRVDPITEPFLLELHKRMFNRTWRWAGVYRSTNKIIGVEFYQIRNLIPALLGDVRYWVDNKTFEPDEIATRVHHRLVWIHPFSNGNGRHTRLLGDVVAVKLGREPFTWGSKELVDAGPVRDEYIRCLRLADENNDNIQPLLNFARS
jgi:Fic-DOC domain mobile mystery protein B